MTDDQSKEPRGLRRGLPRVLTDDPSKDNATSGDPIAVVPRGSRRPPSIWLPDSQAFAFGSVASGWTMLMLANLKGEVTALTESEFEVRRA